MASHLAAVADHNVYEMATVIRQDEAGDEAGLVARAKGRDSRAFEQLYRQNVDKVYALCLRMTSNVAEAEDCVQEAFIQAWKQLEKFRGDASFGTWMHRIAVNAVLGRMRKSKRDAYRLEVVAESTDRTPPEHNDGELRDLSEAIGRLPEGARHVFVLHAVYGYSHDEAADMLGIAAGTSKAQVHRARRLLVQSLKEQGYRE